MEGKRRMVDAFSLSSNNVKQIISFLLCAGYLIFLPLGVFAQPTEDEEEETDTYNFVVWTKDGSQVAFGLSRKPCLTMTGNNMTLQTKTETIEYEMDDIRKFTLDEINSDAIPTIIPRTNTPIPSYSEEAGLFLFSHCQPDSPVSLFTADGKHVTTLLTDGDGTCRLHVQSLPKGVIIVQTNQTTFKIIKK